MATLNRSNSFSIKRTFVMVFGIKKQEIKDEKIRKLTTSLLLPNKNWQTGLLQSSK